LIAVNACAFYVLRGVAKPGRAKVGRQLF